MIKIICKTKKSFLRSLKITGHADIKNHGVVVCTAVSCLSRTACDVSRRLVGVDVKIKAPKPGLIVLNVNNVDSEIEREFSGITDFLIYGLIGVKRDYPESIKLKINNKDWYDGSQERWW